MGINRWVNRHLLGFLKVWVVVFTALTIVLLVQGRNRDSKISHQIQINKQVAKQNRQLISQIQHSRVESCIASYNTILHAFDPFKPLADDPRTPRNEVQDFNLFSNNLIKKRRRCKEQVAVKKERNAKP